VVGAVLTQEKCVVQASNRGVSSRILHALQYAVPGLSMYMYQGTVQVTSYRAFDRVQRTESGIYVYYICPSNITHPISSHLIFLYF
jgi:hypothetical protein